MRVKLSAIVPLIAGLMFAGPAVAAVGDPQLKTDHPWYPGELAFSTFDRLFATEAALYKRVTGKDVKTDEDKALAAFLWRNTHYAHGEEGHSDCFGSGFEKAEWNRDYWTGLFSHGFGLCGTTHAQWNAEFDALLGHCRSRDIGVSGHNSFEVYLTGGAYGSGKWVLLDHDISTVIYSPDGSRLLSIPEIKADVKNLTDPNWKPERQHGWRISGLHDGDAKGVYTSYNTAEYNSGYAGPPPIVSLRSGETLRRYFEPGLDDGKTFAFWGMNYRPEGIPGPSRDRTWVNQPEKMFNSKSGTGGREGQARYGNAVFNYAPDFATAAYKEGVVDEGADHVTFEFRSPYTIATTPSSNDKWGVYKPDGHNGLVVSGSAGCTVKVSIDNGKTWVDSGTLNGKLDLTDTVKGQNQYLLRFEAPAAKLAGKNISWRTVCQANPATFPRLHDGGNKITFAASGVALADAGPTKAQAETHVVDGSIGGNKVTLELKSPRGEKATHVYAVGWVASSNPPDPKITYAIEYSQDGGKNWKPVVKDWKIIRREPEPKDFWSQSFVWGDVALPAATNAPIRVRFSNTGGKQFRKVEAHLAYEVTNPSATEVTFAWTEGGATKSASHTYGKGANAEDASWTIQVGKGAATKWVEMRCP
jgi:hypothetical protein